MQSGQYYFTYTAVIPLMKYYPQCYSATLFFPLKLNFFKKIAGTSLIQDSRYKVQSLHKIMQTFPLPPRIKLKQPYHTYYGSSFCQFRQLELLICTSTLVFKHILHTTMPYISNVKIGCYIISPHFQYTQLQLVSIVYLAVVQFLLLKKEIIFR